MDEGAGIGVNGFPKYLGLPAPIPSVKWQWAPTAADKPRAGGGS